MITHDKLRMNRRTFLKASGISLALPNLEASGKSETAPKRALFICNTLGFYSPWAKVRRLRYIYGNTGLQVGRFDYHASPWAILRGRLIAVVDARVAHGIERTLGFDRRWAPIRFR